jgi:hypothetical protein
MRVPPILNHLDPIFSYLLNESANRVIMVNIINAGFILREVRRGKRNLRRASHLYEPTIN